MSPPWVQKIQSMALILSMFSIRVTFTVADLQNLSESEQLNDEALEDELDGLEDSQSQDVVNKSGRSGNIKVAPEDRIAPSDQPEGEEEGFDEENEPGFPARVNVTIEKPGKGAIHVETVAQDGLIQIENVSYFAKPELANAETAEKEWSRQSLYSGPPFGNLDEEVQVFLERYLDERGIDNGLASIIPDYIEFKEQKEYVGWLSSKLTSETYAVILPLTSSPQTSRSSSMLKQLAPLFI